MNGFNWRFINVDYFSRLVKRFDLQGSTQRIDPLYINNTVQAITDVDKLLEEVELKFATGNLDVVGDVTYFTVPDNERWRLKAMWKETTSVNSISYISDGTNKLYITPGATAEVVDRNMDIDVGPGWTIGTIGTDNIGDISRDLAFQVIVTKSY